MTNLSQRLAEAIERSEALKESETERLRAAYGVVDDALTQPLENQGVFRIADPKGGIWSNATWIQVVDWIHRRGLAPLFEFDDLHYTITRRDPDEIVADAGIRCTSAIVGEIPRARESLRELQQSAEAVTRSTRRWTLMEVFNPKILRSVRDGVYLFKQA